MTRYMVETSENLAKKNNVQLRGLKEHAEGDNLCQLLQNLFVSCVGSGNDVEISLVAAYQIGPWRKYNQWNPRDILVKLSNWRD